MAESNRIVSDSVVDLLFHLKWKSDATTHTDTYQASRFGYSDLGVNRRRIEKNCKRYTKGSAMTTLNKNKYFKVKDKHDNDYLCPLDAVKDRDTVSDQKLDDCVERDVAERYSGHIDIESR